MQSGGGLCPLFEMPVNRVKQLAVKDETMSFSSGRLFFSFDNLVSGMPRDELRM